MVKETKKITVTEPEEPRLRVASGKAKATSLVARVKAWVAVSKKRKVLAIIVAVLVLLAILTAIPATRYPIYGMVVKKDVQFTVLDTVSRDPVTGATVKLGNVSGVTDSRGVVTLKHVPVGDYSVVVIKKFYKDMKANYNVPLFLTQQAVTESLSPTGRPLTITVTNSITGAVLENVTLSVDGGTSITDKTGQATLVVSPKIDKQTILLKAAGYNDANLSIDLAKATTYATTVTPSGNIYYLSNATGEVNVMRSNLDGTSPNAIIKGTGNEDSTSLLLSSRDWVYSAYTAKRDDNPTIYIIDGQGNYSEIDSGDVGFTAIGWSGHTYFYEVNHFSQPFWSANRTVIKAYNADSKKLTTIDKNNGSGNDYNYAYEFFSTVYILDGKIFYLKIPSSSSAHFDNSQKAQAITVNTTSYADKVVQEFPLNGNGASADARLYEPQGVYIRLYSDNADNFYEYEDGAIKSANTITTDKFYTVYPTYLLSPSSNKTLWSEVRNGKNTLFTGDGSGKNQKQIASLSDFTPYGWFGDSDQYILLTKNGSELYIATPGTIDKPQKITDYYRSQIINGYGGGYGGQ